MMYVLASVIAGLFAFVAWREWRHDQERRDLYSRLMAKDLTEYQSVADNQNRPPPQKARNFLRAGMEKHLKATNQASRQEAGE